MATVNLTINLIDMLAWPLHMMPEFLHNLNETSRAMSRQQAFHSLDEM